MGLDALRFEKKHIVCSALILLIVLTVCFIFGNSLKSPAESMEQSGRVLELLRPILSPNGEISDEELSFFIRKTAHFVEYALLGAECAVLAFVINGKMTLAGVLYSAGGCLLTADIDEYIQSFTGRGSMVSDVLLDFSGAVTGILLSFAAAYAIMKTAVSRRKKRYEGAASNSKQ